jgi:hypothetical protein
MEEQQTFEEHDFSLCKRVQERLPDLLEGYLDSMAAEAVRAHLAVCYQCSHHFSELQQTVRLIETLPFVEPKHDYAPAIVAAIEQQPGHSFQAPVVEMETKTLRLVSLQPRTITGRQRHFFPALALAAPQPPIMGESGLCGLALAA